MHLIEALVAGVRGAENGSAHIYQRATTTRVDYYTDFEATALVTQGTGGVTLDANGGAVVYVDQLVTVVVKTSAGATLRTFVAGATAANVEVMSSSFTGTDYSGAPTAAGEPTTLSTVLGAWDDSAGAVDWKVLVGGVATKLSDAMGALSGLAYNVKNSAYGASGLGVLDDGSEIQAAIDACYTAGGGYVYLPAGTYRITAALDLKQNVNLVGAGASCTFLKIDHASNSTIAESTAETHFGKVVEGLTIMPMQANSGLLYQQVVSGRTVFRDVKFGGTLWTGTDKMVDVRGRAHFSACEFTSGAGGAAASHVELSDASSVVATFVGCKFATSVAAFTTGFAFVRQETGSTLMVGCELGGGAATGTLYGVSVTGGLCAAAVCNRLIGGSSTAYLVYSSGAADVNTHIFEAGTVCSGSAHPMSVTGSSTATSNGVAHLSRKSRTKVVTNGNIAANELQAQLYERYVVNITNNSACNIGGFSGINDGVIGDRLIFILSNSSGGISGAITFSDCEVDATVGAGFTVADGTQSSVVFEYAYSTGGGKWVQVAPLVSSS
jgi:hypothetical protein